MTTPTPTPTETEIPQPTMADQFDSIIDKITDNINQMKTLMSDVKQLKKEATKTVKTKKQKKEKDPNKPAPFSKPVEITPELRKFLKQDGDISRTEVTQKMYAYIKEQSLQNPEMKRQFFIDAPLAKLFKIDKGTAIEYFQLQTHMKQHYPPKA